MEIHVIVPGDPQAVQAMEEELNLVFDVEAVDDLKIHTQFELVEVENGRIYPLRGYGIVKDGKITHAAEDNEVGIHSLEILNEANSSSQLDK